MATKYDQESGTIVKKLSIFLFLFYLIYYIVSWSGPAFEISMATSMLPVHLLTTSDLLAGIHYPSRRFSSRVEPAGEIPLPDKPD